MPQDTSGERLDRFLVTVSELSRSQIGIRIDAGDVTVAGRVVSKAGTKMRGGETITMNVPPPAPSKAVAENIPISIVYQDDHLAVVDKRPDMVVHPSPGHSGGTLVNALLYHFGELAQPRDGDNEADLRPGIVHRLDRGTSGLLVVARDVPTRDGLAAQFAAHTAGRQYVAIIHGPKLENSGTFDTFHGRNPKHRKRFTSKLNSGRNAVTHWTVLARAKTAALVRCRLKTGRTHQIRVHFSDHGHPVAGDEMYGGCRRSTGSEGAALRKLTRQALHAYQLEYIHPITGEPMRHVAELPSDIKQVVQALFGDDGLKSIEEGPDGPQSK